MSKYEDFKDFNHVWHLDVTGPKIQAKYASLPNIVAGDTDSGMFGLHRYKAQIKDVPIDDIVEMSDAIADAIDKTFPDFVMKAFNCPAERNHYITTGREVVYDKALYLSKKRYIMHIVDNEGKKVDALKIMGVEIKKSDTAPIVREFLLELVNLILDGEPMEHVLKQVDKMKQRFYEADYFQIAKPTACKTLKAAQDILEMTGKEKGFPYQVKAALAYNRMKGISDREIMAGDRVLFCYVTHMETRGICIPEDLNNIPEFMKAIPIDYEKQWLTAKKKLVNYLTALKWDAKSRKETLKNSLFKFNK